MTMEQSQRHPNYYVVYGALLAALIVSFIIAEISLSPLAVTLIFVIAALKALAVLLYFIHLPMEPKFVKVLVGGSLFALVILFAGFYLDVVGDFGKVATG